MLKQIGSKLFLIALVAGLLLGSGAQCVLAASGIIDQEKLNKAVQLYIEKNMPWPAGTMRFEVLSPLPQIDFPKGKSSWKVEIKEDGEYLGECYFVLKLYSNGVLFREESIRTRIEILQDFVVSAKNINRDSIIGVNDVLLQKKWVRAIPVNTIANLNEVVGKILCIAVRPNTAISRNMLKDVTAVKRGKIVQIVLDSGTMNITTVGLSEEDGAEGAFIRVRNVSSNKTIYAKVIGDSKVKVDFR